MTEGVVWIVAGGALAAALVLVLSRLRAHALRDLRYVLFDEQDPGTYLRLLENPRLRLLFSQRALASLRNDARLFEELTKKATRKEGRA